MAKAAGAGIEEEIESCSRKFGKWRCKNASADNELGYCQKHYKNLELERQKLPPDEDRCSHTNGKGIYRYRCKNFRMGHGAAAVDDDRVPKTKFCENHYNLRAKYYNNLKKKKRCGDGEETRGSKRKREDDNTSDIKGDSGNVGTQTKKKKLPPDEQRCCQTSGNRIYGTWRCKNFRMGLGGGDDSVPKSKHCEKHYNYYAKYNKKKRKGDVDQGAVSGPSDPIVGGGSSKIGAKKKKIETISGELKSATAISEPVLDWENLEGYKTECFQVAVELELEKMKVELEKNTAAARDQCRGSQNEITQTGDNLEEWEDWDCLEERSSFQAHDLEMSKKTIGKLVSDSDDGGDSLGEPEDSNSFVDSKISLGDPMDTLAMNDSNRNKDEIDWKSFLGFPFSYTFGLD